MVASKKVRLLGLTGEPAPNLATGEVRFRKLIS
jgi:hypothetical protein